MGMNLPEALDISASEPLTKTVLDQAFSYIVQRFLLLESFKPDFQAAVDQLNEVGLDRLNQAIQPVYDYLSNVAQIGAIFSTSSTSTVAVQHGPAVFVIAAKDWAGFAAAAYIGVQKRGDPTTYMSGSTSSYDRTTGTLILAIDNCAGSGSAADWVISASVQPPSDLDIATTLNNKVTALQGSVGDQLATFQGTVTTAIGMKAPIDSPSFTGTPKAPLPPVADNSTSIPTTSWVQNLVTSIKSTITSLQASITDVGTALGLRVRVDAAQGLSATQQNQALGNIGAQPALGYTPVQQGTGVGQVGNLIKIGWSGGTNLKATVDTTDLGLVWNDNAANVQLGVTGSINIGSSLILQWTTVPGSTDTTWTYPVAFPNRVLFAAASPNSADTANMVATAVGSVTKTKLVTHPRYANGSSVSPASQSSFVLVLGY